MGIIESGTLRELQRLTGVDASEWCRIFANKKSFNLSTVCKISERLSIEPSQVVQEIEIRKNLHRIRKTRKAGRPKKEESNANN